MTRVGLQVDRERSEQYPVAPIRFERHKPTWDAITPAHPVRLYKKVGVGLGAMPQLSIFVVVVFVVLAIEQPLRPVESVRSLAQIVAVECGNVGMSA